MTCDYGHHSVNNVVMKYSIEPVIGDNYTFLLDLSRFYIYSHVQGSWWIFPEKNVLGATCEKGERRVRFSSFNFFFRMHLFIWCDYSYTYSVFCPFIIEKVLAFQKPGRNFHYYCITRFLPLFKHCPWILRSSDMECCALKFKKLEVHSTA